MCGIFGAVTASNVTPILLEGLQRLEYRGYDSAGIAVSDGERINRRRDPGTVEKLRASVENLEIAGPCGIAHTRWATHGEPSRKNAHPHSSANRRVYVVHNGVIENYRSLIDHSLKPLNVNLSSETDTEVLAHLVNLAMSGRGSNLLQATRETCHRLDGTYGMAVISSREPNTIVATRYRNPLVIGIGDDQARYIASDISAFPPEITRIVQMHDGEFVRLQFGTHQLYDQDGELIDRTPVDIERTQEDTELGTHPNKLSREIFDQPVAVRNTLLKHKTEDADWTSLPASELKKVGEVHLTACGTSYNAALLGQQWIQKFVGVPVAVELGSEMRYRLPTTRENALLVGITQSGETADTLEAMRAAESGKKYGWIASITNSHNSSVTSEFKHAYVTAAGLEESVCSTKTFTATLIALLQLAIKLGRAKNSLGYIQHQEETSQFLRNLPDLITKVLEQEASIYDAAVEMIASQPSVIFIGRDINYPVAHEGALKLKEISYIHAESFAAGELKHGPLALVSEETPIVAIMQRENPLFSKLCTSISEIATRGGRFVLIGTEDASLTNGKPVICYDLPPVPDYLSPFLSTVPIQLIALYTAMSMERNVDRPRNLAKSVTVE